MARPLGLLIKESLANFEIAISVEQGRLEKIQDGLERAWEVQNSKGGWQ